MDYNSGPPRSLTFPGGVAGSTRCTQFDIINDTIQENNEGFNVDFEFVDGMGARKGTVAQSMVIIEDDDGMLFLIRSFECYTIAYGTSIIIITDDTLVSQKCTHGRNTLQACERSSWALFQVFYNIERVLLYVYINSMPSNSSLCWS